jgi:hypothetical protein
LLIFDVHVVDLTLFVIFELFKCDDIVSKSLFGHICNLVLAH